MKSVAVTGDTRAVRYVNARQEADVHRLQQRAPTWATRLRVGAQRRIGVRLPSASEGTAVRLSKIRR
ncbi:hypothetical protein AAC03nite_24910 [Alicyclobacillus acidoterrestris]|nr:hypothetical protein AAC03nite_24910 [Alicyclobacillus acidoterrestris]